MEQTNAVFDAARPITLKLRTPEGVKTIGVRFPTDEEWIERQRRRKVLIKQLGRGVSETVISGGEDADAALLTKIRQGEGPDVDPFEASRVIDQLGQCDVDDVVQEGDAFRVTLRVIGGTVEHVLRMPSAKDVFDYRRAFARVLDLPYNRQELTVNLAAGGALYKKLATLSDGYAGEPPIIHQAVSVRATIDALDASFQETGDPN
ncbi:MAG: hypothetical protein M9913_17105 [Bryobacteraceae bacterium]|nr:hypothetical protein [Solibacteraceae bacterium]MCO5352586.1 hypothetical protein [Bryobacteraceae bacterium]